MKIIEKAGKWYSQIPRGEVRVDGDMFLGSDGTLIKTTLPGCVNHSEQHYREIDTITENGKTYRRLVEGETILESDLHRPYWKPWVELGPIPIGHISVGLKWNPSRFIQFYRLITGSQEKKSNPLDKLVTITYKVTAEYAMAQAREAKGKARNANIQRRFNACEDAVNKDQSLESLVDLRSKIATAALRSKDHEAKMKLYDEAVDILKQKVADLE